VAAACHFLAPFFTSDGTLARVPKKIEALISAWRVVPASVRRQVQVSRHLVSNRSAGSARTKRRARRSLRPIRMRVIELLAGPANSNADAAIAHELTSAP
jgi:hypothetical protein